MRGIKYKLCLKTLCIVCTVVMLMEILTSYELSRKVGSVFVDAGQKLHTGPNHTGTGTARKEHTEASGTSVRMTSPLTQQQQHQELVFQGTNPTEDDFIRRQKRYMDACASSSSGSILEVFVYEPNRLAVCHTPKVGCTFWKRIMSYLLQETGKTVQSPYEIDRYYIHHGAKPNRFAHRSTDPRLKAMLPNLTRVAFTRDPYSRLWSAFVDKIILPDSWKDHGLSIYKHRRLGNVECPLNITFEDFLIYATNKRSDVHWNPLYTVCNPCTLFPQYIGKMETFSRDTKYILNKVGLGYLLSNKSQTSHAEDEMRMLIAYHFELQSRRDINKKCLTTTDVTRRLWRAFQFNGYISLDEVFPEQRVQEVVDGLGVPQARDEVTRLILQHYRDSTATNVKKQRRTVLVNAYKQIPLDLRENIRKKYEHDFDLYDYEPYPADIFPEKTH
ncbi:carbohydrate sulfotransferase 8-like [Haliotis rubra]|uniref:carbohydrate sulfotransferase 8-like n=1 Tax=Haliotis rubra TaxID=36100 RepID=UPI001EE5AF8A|nr:carbohydrate sulfotransferase 8-like [Haliotis rubra]